MATLLVLHSLCCAALSFNPCTLGEEVHLENNIFENQFFNYKKITKNILTVEKKFQNFSKKNDQHLLGANFFLQNWQGYIFGKV